MKRRFFLKNATAIAATALLPMSALKASEVFKSDGNQVSSARLREKLRALESVFDGNLNWVINLYDTKTGGFCESVGMTRDPQFPAHIQATCQIVGELMNVNGLLSTMPVAVKDRIVSFINDNQDPVTGLFCDKAYPKIKESKRADRNIARLTGFAVRTLKTLDAKPRYDLISESNNATPLYLQSAKNWEEWVRKTVSKERPFYGSLDDVGSHTSILLAMPESQRKEFIDVATNYINPFQNTATGLWDNSLDATFKYVGFLNGVNRPIPHAEKIVASIYTWFEVNKNNFLDNTCFVCNPVRMLPELSSYIPKEFKTDKALSDLVEWHMAHFQPFLQSDGAFSRWQKKFPKDVLDTVYGQWDEPMADVNGNAQTIVARRCIYKVVGIEMPPLPQANGFWDRFVDQHKV